METGIVGAGDQGSLWSSTKLDLGLRTELLLGRSSPRDFGFGPWVQARTTWFDGADYGGGAVALLPVDSALPIWVGAGAFERRRQDSWSPGIDAFIGFGSRSYDYHDPYAMVLGATLDVRAVLGPVRQTDVILCLQLDLEVLAMPAMYLFSRLLHA
ncbi:MAG: hypothetical protein ACHREM_27000 [Polyangiales bacterium]